MRQSINSIAQFLGMDRRVLTNRIQGLPFTDGPKNAKLFDVQAAMRVLFGANGDEELNPAIERALLDRERRRSLEMQNARAAGELIPASVVSETWVQHVAIAKGRLLALPARIAPAVIGLSDLRAVENVIRDAIHEALTELANSTTETEADDGHA